MPVVSNSVVATAAARNPGSRRPVPTPCTLLPTPCPDWLRSPVFGVGLRRLRVLRAFARGDRRTNPMLLVAVSLVSCDAYTPNRPRKNWLRFVTFYHLRPGRAAAGLALRSLWRRREPGAAPMARPGNRGPGGVCNDPRPRGNPPFDPASLKLRRAGKLRGGNPPSSRRDFGGQVPNPKSEINSVRDSDHYASCSRRTLR